MVDHSKRSFIKAIPILGSALPASVASEANGRPPEPGSVSAADQSRSIHSGYLMASDHGVEAGTTTIDNGSRINHAMQRAYALNIREVSLPAGRIFCQTPLIPVPHVKLVGHSQSAILDFSKLDPRRGVFSSRGSFEQRLALTEGAPKRTRLLEVYGHNLIPGDWVRIDSSVDAMSNDGGQDRLGDRDDFLPFAESRQVAEVVDSHRILLSRSLRYNYPVGSTLRRFRPLSSFGLSELVVDQNGGGNGLGSFELFEDLQVENVKFKGVRGPVHIRNAVGNGYISDCLFEGDRSINIFGSPSEQSRINLQHLKIVDGSMFFRAQRNTFTWGGQCVDVTYTPSSEEFRAPCIGIDISGSRAFETSYSAFTDHPGMDGTVANDLFGEEVAGLLFIRSRHSHASGCIAYGGSRGRIGVWLGENGYFRSATIRDCQMYDFDVGFSIAGQGDTLGRRDVKLDSSRAERCRIGIDVGPTTVTGGDCGTQVRNFHAADITETHIQVHASNTGVNIEGFSLRGPTANAGIEITSEGLKNASFRGEVIDLGRGIPPLKNLGNGAACGNLVDIARRGINGKNVGVSASSVSVRSYRLAARTFSADEALAPEHSLCSIPTSVCDETATISIYVEGSSDGSLLNRVLALHFGDVHVSSVVFVAGHAGRFVINFSIAFINNSSALPGTFDGIDPIEVEASNVFVATTLPIPTSADEASLFLRNASVSAGSISIRGFNVVGAWA